ncbi:hypothetical protein CC117_29585 [Parafrankia colletiae]|uniref:Uncharacterized protein n=1 Tax=Parafrankia colletiae TaxID=573497 RepID=A0A1S1Q6Q1_9ACTN|nr:hypothetical protein [Parafrankia colletiae]MCK9903988.1 hypothetical protein [Frankia sp. Cpl3]OHV28875.1 hypothetical protein CC117_29585 [Parafrankia colletiae]
MLYLAGQILVFVLVAMLIGAGLAWLFLAAPLRRQARGAEPAATETPNRGDAGEETIAGQGRGVSSGGSVIAFGVDGSGAVTRDGVDRFAGTRTPGPVVSVGVDARGAADGLAGDDAWRPAASRVSPADLAELLTRLRDQEQRWAAEKAELAGRLVAAERQATESAHRVASAEQQVVVAQARIDEIESALHAAPAEIPAAGTPAVVEQTAGPAGVPGAVSATAPVVTGTVEDVETVVDLARETARLRVHLEEAETRAAKFSSRLAMVRTEAEGAQRQVATMSTRLDRHQAEWAAERIRLLARIAEAEEARAEVPTDDPDVGGQQAELPLSDDVDDSVEEEAVLFPPADEIVRTTDEHPPADEPALPAGERTSGAGGLVASGASMALESGEAVGSGEAWEPADEMEAVGRSERGEAAVPFQEARASGSAFDAGPLLYAVHRDNDLELVGAALVGAAASAAMAEQHHVSTAPDVAVGVGAGSLGHAARSAPMSWGGPAEPLPSSDNLKEIVGVGPVVESRLRVLGITSFRQLAAMGDTDVDRLAKKLDGFGGRIVSDDWVGQARDLQARHHSGLA